MVAFGCMCVLWLFISCNTSFCCFIAKWELKTEMWDSPRLFSIWALWFPCLFWSSPLVCVHVSVCDVQRRCIRWSGFFFFSLKKHHKNQPNKWDFFFVVYASSKLQGRSIRRKSLLLFHLGKQLSVGFFPFVAGPGTRKEILKEVRAVVLISYIYVLLMWEEDAPSPLFSSLALEVALRVSSVWLLLGGRLLLVVRASMEGASSLQSSCLPHRGLRGALLPVLELQRKLTRACCSASASGMGRGRAQPLPCSPAFGLGIPPQIGGRGWGQVWGMYLVRDGENSAVALAEEQKSPPFPQAGLSCFSLL